MNRNREARRMTMARRRYRSNTRRDSPEEDGAVEMHEPARLRERGSGKKNHDRERDRDRENERDRLTRSSKRRRGDRLMHSSNREYSSDESVNDKEEDDGDYGAGGGSVRMFPLNPSSLNHRKSFPPAAARVFRSAPSWKTADEIIGVFVPRKARSASTKRSYEFWASSGALAGEQIHRQASTSPASPSSSTVSIEKKIKPDGPKLRPLKSSSAQEEIEIEIAEVLYGMRQRQGPSNDSLELDSQETYKPSSEGKSSSSVTPLSAAAPKWKRPRTFKYEDENPAAFAVRNSSISLTAKAESDHPSKFGIGSPNCDKNSGSVAENSCISHELANSQATLPSSKPWLESINLESNLSSDSKLLTEESEREDVGLSKEKPPQSPKKESPVSKLDDNDPEDVKATKVNSTISGCESLREEKLQIDLMAPPPSLRSSPERDVEISFVAGSPKPMVVDAEEVKPVKQEDGKSLKMSMEDAVVAVETEKARVVAEEAGSQKLVIVQKERGTVLQLDSENRRDTSGSGNMVNNKHNQNIQRQQQPNSEKTMQSSSVPLPMSVPGWPGGLPPLGYMMPFQVMSMDETTMSSGAVPPYPKRCATHCYIARTILYQEQIARMNPFWSAAAGSASLCGAKPCNLNVMPCAELDGNVSRRAGNSALDKGHHLPIFSGHAGKEKGSQAANSNTSQRKQILLQQPVPPGAPNNILHGPNLIFPLNQQQAVASSVRPGSVNSLPAKSSGPSSGTSNPAPVNTSGTQGTTAPTMIFSYANMPGNEKQYLAIMQNNAYPLPIPARVSAIPAYQGTRVQALPFFNGSFFSSQMLHPSQLQQQQLHAHSSQQSQQGHQNTSMCGGSSSSQKHLQNQQQKPHVSGSNVGGSLQGFPASKNQISQPLPLQQQQHQRQQLQNHPIMLSHHNFQVMATSQAAQQKKNHDGISEEGKSGGDPSNPDEDRKAMSRELPTTGGDPSLSTGNGVIHSSTRTLNQLQKHHQYSAAAATAARSKTPSLSNGSVYSDHLPSTASKFPNAVSAFPQNLVQRTAISQSSSPSLASTPSSSVKALPQQANTRIFFAAATSMSPSAPVMVGLPTTSMSRNAGSPGITSTLTGNKVGLASYLSSQQAKNSQGVPNHKLPSILGGSQQISKQSLQHAQLFFSNAYMLPEPSQSSGSTSTTPTTSAAGLQRRGGPVLPHCGPSEKPVEQKQPAGE